ncbi:MAG: hypothetical protein WC326_02075 [Candidatus Delongbacteria bacterium]
MPSDGVGGRLAGPGRVYLETPAAWEILAILDRKILPMESMLELLAGFKSEDLQAAYWLTRRRADLERRQVLSDGAADGRAARIQARNILVRAAQQNLMIERSRLLAEEAGAILEEVRGSPPPLIGTHLRSVIQVLVLAGSPQPLLVRLRRLLAVRPIKLEEALQRLRGLPPSAWLRSGWPSRLERPHMAWVLEQAILLQKELLADRKA